MQTLETEFVQLEDKNKRRTYGDVMIETRRAVRRGKQIRKGLGNKKKKTGKVYKTANRDPKHWEKPRDTLEKRPGRGHISRDNKLANQGGNRAD